MTVLDQAANVRGVVAAARQRDRWGQAMAKTSDPEKREAYREAIADLEARFPEIEDLGPGESEAFARERGHGSGARSPSHEGRRRPGATKRRESAPTAKPPARGPVEGRAGKATRGSRGGARRRRSSTDRRVASTTAGLVRQTGIPSALGSGTSVTMSAIGATVGLSIVYLMLSAAEGKKGSTGAKALPELLGSAATFLDRLIGKGDILGGGARAKPVPIRSVPNQTRAGMPGSKLAGPPYWPGLLPEVSELPPDWSGLPPGRNLLPRIGQRRPPRALTNPGAPFTK